MEAIRYIVDTLLWLLTLLLLRLLALLPVASLARLSAVPSEPLQAWLQVPLSVAAQEQPLEKLLSTKNNYALRRAGVN